MLNRPVIPLTIIASCIVILGCVRVVLGNDKSTSGTRAAPSTQVQPMSPARRAYAVDHRVNSTGPVDRKNNGRPSQEARPQAKESKQPVNGPESRLRNLMEQLGIQREKGVEDYMDVKAPNHDRDRVPRSARVRPPDAFHAGPAVASGVVNDPRKLRNLRASVSKPGGRQMRGRAIGAGFAGYGYGTSPAGQFGSVRGGVGPYESGTWQGQAGSSTMQSLNNYGPGWGGTAGTGIGNGNYGYGIGSQSSSRLIQGGSPSDYGSQVGSPSSTNTIGSGNTLSGSGAMPGATGLGTGAGTFGPGFGAAGS